MKKLLIASVSGIALLGLAACSENPDGTTTQSVPAEDPAMAPADPGAAPMDAPATDPMAPAPAE